MEVYDLHDSKQYSIQSVFITIMCSNRTAICIEACKRKHVDESIGVDRQLFVN